MTATRLWAWNELRQRWRAFVVLGVLAGVAGGLALGAVVQAHRSSTVYSRYRVATAAPDAIVFGTQTAAGIEGPLDYTPVLRLPEVVDAGAFNLSPVGVRVGKALIGGLPTDDQHLYRTTARPLLRAGRITGAGRQDEVVVNLLAARTLHLHVGSRVTVASSANLDNFFTGGALDDGPAVAARVVGIGDTPLDEIFTIDETAAYPNGAFLADHPEIPRFPNLVVRLKPGTDVARFHERVAAAMHQPDVPVRDLAEERKRFVHGTDLERTALLLFAAAIVLAAAVLVGQALARTIYAMAPAGRTLGALGLTRTDVAVAMMLPALVTAAIASGAAIAVAVALSDRFTVGLSRALEPHLGVHADWPRLVAGAVVVALLVVVGSAVAALRATSVRVGADVRGRGLGLLALIRSSAPLPAALGATYALDPGRGQRATPVRPALAGAAAGVIGIVGVLGLVRGIDDALAVPDRAGQTFDGYIWADDSHTVQQLGATVRSSPAAAAIAEVTRRPLDVSGQGLPVYAITPVKGHPSFVVLEGRAPHGDREVAIAPSSLKILHKRVGDDLQVRSERFRIVGRALLPQTPHSSFDQGVWATPAGMAKLHLPSDPNDTQLGVRAPRGMNLHAFDRAMHARVGANTEVDLRAAPQDLLLLRNVRTLPRVLAAFLGLLGVAALGHALVTSVRRRRHDLAVLRAMGLRPRQMAWMIGWQATTVALVGLVVGLPLGVALGRISWRWVANSTPLLYVAPVAGLAIALAVPSALAIANGLAALPARRAARLRAVDVLRTE